MFWKILVIFIYIFISQCVFRFQLHFSSILDIVIDAKCQNVYTYGYGYRKFYNLPQSSFQNGKIVFNFSLTAMSNGHVLFSESTNVFYAYEVVLGAGGNEFSEIRKYNRHKMEPKTHLMTKNILSQMQPKNFSVSMNQLVKVYQIIYVLFLIVSLFILKIYQ